MIDPARKEEVLIEALPYIQTYEGKTFVIKYGGAVMTEDRLKQTFAKDVTILRKIGINIIIVHGGEKRLLRRRNLSASRRPLLTASVTQTTT